MQIRYEPTGAVLAEGPLGWGITPFEGNYYICRRYLREGRFRPDFIPGMCIYKGLYVGLDYIAPDGAVVKHLGWMYWLPNPLFPFIVFRVAIPAAHPSLMVVAIDEQAACATRREAQADDTRSRTQMGSVPSTKRVTRHAP